ncbi:hypothetical protein CCACVL1_06636 [Corchorus capsularis]|uniref:Uncharacterized protein n=1 Tax=Corchorus capsularis TaxID=210143 RepID=A0A1R3JE45_COCAP|nr:hypothetical protein CCACVL1_06636 [Corchorus capsularis]
MAKSRYDRDRTMVKSQSGCD